MSTARIVRVINAMVMGIVMVRSNGSNDNYYVVTMSPVKTKANNRARDENNGDMSRKSATIAIFWGYREIYITLIGLFYTAFAKGLLEVYMREIWFCFRSEWEVFW